METRMYFFKDNFKSWQQITRNSPKFTLFIGILAAAMKHEEYLSLLEY